MKNKKKNIIQEVLATRKSKYRRIPTPDDFCGTNDDGTVEVGVILFPRFTQDDPHSIRTCVWGNDDFGLERDEFFKTEKEAHEAYHRRIKEVNGWAIVTIKTLREMGFIGA